MLFSTNLPKIGWMRYLEIAMLGLFEPSMNPPEKTAGIAGRRVAPGCRFRYR